MTEVTQQEKIEALAALILGESRERLARMYSQSQADAETVQVHPRKLYTLIDRGPAHNMSGMLMIEHATGNVYGIKGYGKVHRGHCYGTLDTTDGWYWGDYYPRKRAASDPAPVTADPEPAPEAEPQKYAVGDGATLHWHTDAEAFTVIAVTAKTITIQRDIAVPDPDWKRDFTPGGFLGHTSNDRDLKYTYKRDPEGRTRVARLTSKGWTSNGQRVTPGRHEYYDSNF